jgi:hypothetical protein
MFAMGQTASQTSSVSPAESTIRPGFLSKTPNPQIQGSVSPEPTLSASLESNVHGLVCTIYIGSFDLFSLSLVLEIYSTFKVEPSCNETDYVGLTVASILAQSRIVTGSSKVIGSGIHAFTMDVNLTPVSNPFFSIGNLRFSKIGEVRISILNAFRRKTLDLANVVNITYSPFTLQSKTHYIWNIGSLIHRLVAPNGDSYIMYSYTNQISSSLNRDTLIDLSGQLRLPEGWRYENELLNKTVTIRPTPLNDYGSEVLFDELNNFYVKYTR